MIRPIVFFGLYVALICWTGPACKNDPGANQTAAADSTALADTAGTHIPPPPPPPNPVIDKKVDEQTEKSPFKNLGCCSDKIQRKTEDCCCWEVLKMYKKMRATDDKNIAKLKMEDPILAVCRKKLKTEFEKVDNPPPPPGEKPSTDDLY